MIGTATTLLLWALEVPSPAVLGALLGAMSLVPYVGILFAAVPAVLLAAALRPGPVTLALVAVLVALQVGAAVVQERVHHRSLRVGPAVIVVAAMVGFAAYGPGGAVFSVATAVFASAFLDVATAEPPDPAATA